MKAWGSQEISHRSPSLPLRSRHRPKSTDKDLGLPISVGESVIIHSGLSSALTSPRLYDQYTLHTALAGYVDPSGLSPRLKSAFLGVCRGRENRTLASVFEEMRLETVVSRLSRRYYQSHLKHRLFKVLKLNLLLPKALAHISTALLAKHWRNYREKVGLFRASIYKESRLERAVFKAWKQLHFYIAAESRGKEKYMRKFFNCWVVGLRYGRLESRRNWAIMGKIIREWTRFSHKIALLRVYFQALAKFTRTHKAFRVSNSIRLAAFRGKLQGQIQARVFHSLITALKEEIQKRFNSYVQSSVKLHNSKLKAARWALLAWNGFVQRPIPQTICKKKVFRAVRIVLERKKARIRATAKVRFGVKSRFFREWLDLLLSGVSVQIRAAEATRSQHQLSSVFLPWVSLWTARRYRLELASQHQSTALLRRALEGWKAVHTATQSIRQQKAYRNAVKNKCFSAWRRFWEDLSLFHHSVLQHFKDKRRKNLLYWWRKGTILSQMQDEQLSGSFQIASCLQSAFDELKEGLYRKKLVQLHRKKVKRLLKAWRGVIESLHFYQNQAYNVSFSSKSMEDSVQNDSFAISTATKLVTLRLQETKKQVRIRRFQAKVVKERKLWVWKLLERAVWTSKRNKFAILQGNKRFLTHVVEKWRETWEERRKYSEKEERAKGKIGEIRRKQALIQLRSYAIGRISARQRQEFAFSHFYVKKAAFALTFLFNLSQKHKNRRNLVLKLQLSIQKRLLSKTLNAFKLHRNTNFLSLSVRKALSKSCKLRCFSAFKSHFKCKQICILIRKNRAKRSLQALLSGWNSLFQAKTALKQEDFSSALQTNEGKAWKWVQKAVLEKRRKARGLQGLLRYGRKRQMSAQKYSKVQGAISLRSAAFAFKSWKIYCLSKTFRRKNVLQRLKFAFKALLLRRFQGRLRLLRLKRTLRMLFWAWRGRNRQTSTHHYMGFSGDQSLCRRPQLMQIFRVLRRKTLWKKRISAWKVSKKALFVGKIWLAMKEIKRKFAFERDQIFHIRKKLLVEMKQFFRSTRLAVLFRRRKQALKALQALKLETFAAQISPTSEDQSVFLYLPKSEAAKVQELLANESSLIDQHQIDLENELSFLTFELQRSVGESFRAPASALVLSNVMTGLSPEKAGRKLMESEQEGLRMYVQYRHSMRKMERGSQSPARVLTPLRRAVGRGKREKMQGKMGKGDKWTDYSLSDALKIDDLEDFRRPE